MIHSPTFKRGSIQNKRRTNKKCRQRLLCIPIKVISEYTAQQNTPIRIAYLTNELMQDILNIYFVYWFKLVHYFERCFNATFRMVWFVCYCKILWALKIFVKESSKKFAKLMRWLNKIQISLVVWMMWNKFWWVFLCVRALWKRTVRATFLINYFLQNTGKFCKLFQLF